MKTNAKPAQKPSVKKAGFRHRKRILVIVILLVIAAAAAVFLFRLRSQNADVSRITTYNVEEITYGNVSTTVSGSGTLTPVTSETLTASAAGEVQSVNFSVGDEVAPGGSVAMVMGKDGFTMGIAVDELNISSIALDQEVAFTIDAVDGDSYEEDAINTEDLTRVTVETGMSDGSYIMIESNDLEEGDLIVVTQITSTLTGAEGENESEMGGFPGGGMGGGMEGFPGGDMDFSDFDFENFDPGQMPQGGSFPGMGE